MRQASRDETRFHDPGRLRCLRAIVSAMDPGAPPEIRLVCPGRGDSVPSCLGILSGSFNPLTRAHLALARSALDASAVGGVAFLLAKQTVDKVEITGMSLEDRLLVLCTAAESSLGLAVALTNRGLYAEQAQAIHTAFPRVRQVSFLVGFDKIVQIFDPRYYVDRDASLSQLFAHSALLVAPRGTADARDLEGLLARPENHAFRDGVHVLGLAKPYREMSSSQARAAIASGAEWQSAVPDVVREFVEATGAYSSAREVAPGESVDAYAVRMQLLAALDRIQVSPSPREFARLVRLAIGPTEHGRRLRADLSDGSLDEIKTTLGIVTDPSRGS